MSVLIPGLFFLAAAAQHDAAKLKTLSTDFVTKASTAELAKAVLPPQVVAKVVGHKLMPPYLHWLEGYPALFWERATVIEPGFCQRATYYVSMPQQPKGTLTPSEQTPGVQIKMAANCSNASEPFIHLNGTPPPEAIEVLRRLSEVRRAARGKGELRTDVDCRSEQNPNPCRKGARGVLAALPLENTSILQRGGPAYDGEDWRVSIKPENATGHYWQLSLFNWSTDRPRVRISWDVIPPF
jgi:hypothetical protein